MFADEQTAEDLLTGANGGISLDRDSSRRLANDGDFGVWIAKSPSTGEGPASICLAIRVLSDPQLGATGCATKQEIANNGYLWVGVQLDGQTGAYFYLEPDAVTGAIPDSDARQVSTRARLFTGSSPPGSS
ncbi:hypothetical protein [Microbacterium sp. cx-59]|uniref:hypothetical protein n=1 Tax=Microbacterium sp. cx-59 TaxID=2891207 RepID=UPI001E4DAC06|nr:hypothetical protein [Microbacterium sp. cx-59]MCC4908395.1 hypothetical protein [Microbacterium sp. cx-59]